MTAANPTEPAISGVFSFTASASCVMPLRVAGFVRIVSSRAPQRPAARGTRPFPQSWAGGGVGTVPLEVALRRWPVHGHMRPAMDMHHVRYFLAVARTLHFTRAADECNVTQPSLTRAIKQLEDELGGDLFRRERPQAQLTELGQRMHPLLKQCYEAAAGARSLASAFKSGEIGALRIALTHSVDLSLLIPFLSEIKRKFNRLEFRFLRGT